VTASEGTTGEKWIIKKGETRRRLMVERGQPPSINNLKLGRGGGLVCKDTVTAGGIDDTDGVNPGFRRGITGGPLLFSTGKRGLSG